MQSTRHHWIVRFGGHRGQTFSEAFRDRPYVDWVLSQPDARTLHFFAFRQYASGMRRAEEESARREEAAAVAAAVAAAAAAERKEQEAAAAAAEAAAAAAASAEASAEASAADKDAKTSRTRGRTGGRPGGRPRKSKAAATKSAALRDKKSGVAKKKMAASDGPRRSARLAGHL